MTAECTNVSGGISAYGKTSSITVSPSSELAIKMPASLSNAFVIYLGSTSASFSSSGSVSGLSETADYLYA